jgi:glycerol-3-phosphate acyltransferase PlsX
MMKSSDIYIAVDAMGGDNAPNAPVEGAVMASQALGLNVVLVGREDVVQNELAKYGQNLERISVVHSPDYVTMEDAPTVVLRKKREASVMTAFRLVTEKKAHGVVSAGNSGATMASAVLILGRIKGVDRPAIAGNLPNAHGFTVVIDIGANVNCKPQQLVQFGIMGDVYARHMHHIDKPRVGLLSIGEEDSKGNSLVKTVHEMLRNSHLNFLGNVEGRDVFNGEVDVVICDGFVGNVLLKVSEGIGAVVFAMIEEEVAKDPSARASFLLSQNAFAEAKKRIDYEEVGGAPLLGINGVGIVSHGASSAKAIKNAIRVAHEQAFNQVEQFLRQGIEQYYGNH